MSPGCRTTRSTRKIPAKGTNGHTNEANVNTYSDSQPVQPSVKNPLAAEIDINPESGSL